VPSDTEPFDKRLLNRQSTATVIKKAARGTPLATSYKGSAFFFKAASENNSVQRFCLCVEAEALHSRKQQRN
jgi:hypothetical protein